MTNFNHDIKVNQDFDLEINEGDIKTSDREETLKQEVNNRLRTNNPDWFRHYIGSDLEDLKGEKNLPEVAAIGESKITKALTEDGLLSDDDFQIRYAPTGVNEITYFITVSLGYNENITINHVLELN